MEEISESALGCGVRMVLFDLGVVISGFVGAVGFLGSWGWWFWVGVSGRCWWGFGGNRCRIVEGFGEDGYTGFCTHKFFKCKKPGTFVSRRSGKHHHAEESIFAVSLAFWIFVYLRRVGDGLVDGLYECSQSGWGDSFLLQRG